MKCFYCNNILLNNSTLYRGYDSNFCSNICRNKVMEINLLNDPKLSEYQKWINYKNPPKHLEASLKRTQSIININKCKELKILEETFNQKINESKILKINFQIKKINQNSNQTNCYSNFNLFIKDLLSKFSIINLIYMISFSKNFIIASNSFIKII